MGYEAGKAQKILGGILSCNWICNFLWSNLAWIL